MNPLDRHLDDYLALRRSLGFSLATDERILRAFTRHAGTGGAAHLTTALFLDWKAAYGRANAHTRASRLRIVRGFAMYLVAHDDHSEVPPAGLIPARIHRSRPHIYSAGELALLVAEAGRLPSAYGLRGLLWQTLFGLVAVTGLRISEALRLAPGDVDPRSGVLLVRDTKTGRTRRLPLRSCAADRLRRYAGERDRLLGGPFARFFVKEDGVPPTDCCARYNFARVGQRIGLRERQRFCRYGRGPRIHDLRHSFAVHTITDWFRQGCDIEREMYRLSAWLGHARPEHTYWYIEAVPELLRLAAERADGLRVDGGRGS